MKCERKYTVYMLRNRFNDKKYFGITCGQVNKRWRHGLGYKKQSRFYNAILKYGWDEGFDHVILAVDLTEECAKDIERLLIAVFNTQNPEFGYNLTAGGDENLLDNPVVKAKHDEALKKLSADPEWRKKQREAMKKVYADPEYQKNYREAMKKMHADPEYQKNHREAMKKVYADPKWQEAMKKRSADPEWQKKVREGAKKRCKKVLCVETKIVYDSQKEAAIAMNLKKSGGICLCCKGEKAKAGGYHWEYVDEELKNKYVPYASKHKRVLCVETKIVYDSPKEAAIAVNLKWATDISRCCRGERKTAGGYHWEYA